MPVAVSAGWWACDLASETLSWSDGVHALFGVRRGEPLERRRIVECYDRESRVTLERLRVAAIRARTGFAMDARIRGLHGQNRLIRIIARVGRDRQGSLRLFGTKHDVTEQVGPGGMRLPPPAILF